MPTKEKISRGETLFNEGRLDEAEACFLAAIKESPASAEALNNLAVIAAQKQNLTAAIDYLIGSLQIDPFQREAVLNCAEIANMLGQPDIARPVLKHYLDRHPDDTELAGLLGDYKETETAKAKVAVLCLPLLDSFLGDIVDNLGHSYEVRTGYDGRLDSIRKLVAWADIVWLEWANELTARLTNELPELKRKHVICRLHSYEAFAGFVSQIKWERIDDLIFVADHIKEQVLLQQPDLEQKVKRIHILPNGINLDRFAFTERTKGHNLAFVGDINYKKGPLLLFHAFAELVRRDPRYTLSVAGRFQDDRFALYFSQMTKELGLEKNLRFDGWVDDISGWLDDKQYIVSSSLLEGHPVGLMEGMARGLKPVIHNFVGARGIYDDRFVWNTIDEFVAMVTSDDYDSAAYRAFIEDNFSLTRQLEQLKEIFGRIEKEINDR